MLEIRGAYATAIAYARVIEDEAVERMKGNTRRYARKQLTWFKRDPEVRWFHPDAKEEILNYISQYE